MTGVDVSVPCVLNIGILPLPVTAFRLAESMRLKEERLKKDIRLGMPVQFLCLKTEGADAH